MAGQRIWGTLLCAVLLFAPPPAASARPVPAPPAAEKTAEIIAGIDRTLSDAAANGFGGAIIIEQGHRTLLSKGYGYADRKRRLAFTPGTIAQIGSITKNLTAAALATLIAEHKVALSDTVAKFFPEAPEPGRSRSIAQLLSHRSGLLESCTEDFHRQSEAMLVRTCLAKPLAHAPGEDEYSNMGYSVLALIIQRVTGERWENAVRERVWKPLGMRDIGFTFRGRSDDRFARGDMGPDGIELVLGREAAAGADEEDVGFLQGFDNAGEAILVLLVGIDDGHVKA